MYNNYGENQSNLKFLFVFSMKKYQGNRACCCSLWQMVIRRDSRVSTVPMPATPAQPRSASNCRRGRSPMNRR